MHRPSLVVLILLYFGILAAEVSCLQRTIIIGDLHGDLPSARRLLRSAEAIDCNDNWTGGSDTNIVQMGDVTDRGPQSHMIIEYFATLKRKAELHGSRVIQLVGNHELMNVIGDLRYVNPQNTAVFGGLDGYRRAFSPSGDYGKHIINNFLTAFVLNGTLFVHGGLIPTVVDYYQGNFSLLNKDMRRVMRTQNKTHPLASVDSPVWSRAMLLAAQRGDCSVVNNVITRLNKYRRAVDAPLVQRIVVGHTIQSGGFVSDLCGNKLFAVDVCISRHMGSPGESCGYQAYVEMFHKAPAVHMAIRYPYPYNVPWSRPFRKKKTTTGGNGGDAGEEDSSSFTVAAEDMVRDPNPEVLESNYVGEVINDFAQNEAEVDDIPVDQKPAAQRRRIGVLHYDHSRKIYTTKVSSQSESLASVLFVAHRMWFLVLGGGAIYVLYRIFGFRVGFGKHRRRTSAV